MKKIYLLGLLFLAGLFAFPSNIYADTFNPSQINYNYQLGTYQGDNRQAYRWYIILHESGNQNDVYDSNAVQHEATYMRNNYGSAYSTFFVGGGGQVYQIGEPGYVAWAALSANPYSPVQIELARTANRATFESDYSTYISLARYYANYYGIPLTLDSGGAGTAGVKTHMWVTNHYGGDHQDPYSYLASWGITKQKLASDLANGINSAPETSQVPQPARNVVTIQNGPSTGIAGWNGKGKIIAGSNSTLRNNTSWQTDGIKIINGLPMYKVATDEYIPKKYTNQSGIVTINSIHGVNAYHADGTQWNGTASTFTDLSAWKTFDNATKVINGRLFFQVSPDQYIDAYYTIGGGNH